MRKSVGSVEGAENRHARKWVAISTNVDSVVSCVLVIGLCKSWPTVMPGVICR